ncbi:MAG: flagellar hook-length control protein FliK [Rhodanobacter sp.]
MPAPTAAPASAPASVPRSAPTSARADNTGNKHFSRQLDAARQQHAPADDGAGGKPGTLAGEGGPAQASPADTCTLAVGSGMPRVDGPAPDASAAPEAGDKTDDSADETSVTGVPQCVLTLFLPTAATAATPKGGAAQALPLAVAANAGKGCALAAAQAALQGNAQSADPAAGNQPLDHIEQAPAAMVQILAGAKPALHEASGDAPTGAVGAPTAQAGMPAAPLVQVVAPVGTPAFAPELSQQITWFASQDIKHARIRLHPEELGMVDLKITVHHGNVDVAFTAQHPGAVLALQQSLPQLDQMLAQQGLSLGHSEVSQHGRDDASDRGRGNGGGDGADDTAAVGAVTVTRSSLNLLDAFA